MYRDAALARVGHARRWMIAGAAGLTAGLAAFVSATAHGRTLSKTHAPIRSVSSSPSTSARMPPLASPSQLGLQGPAQDPQPATSGGGGQSSSGGGGSGSGGSGGGGQSQPSQSAPPAPSSSSGSATSGGS